MAPHRITVNGVNVRGGDICIETPQITHDGLCWCCCCGGDSPPFSPLTVDASQSAPLTSPSAAAAVVVVPLSVYHSSVCSCRSAFSSVSSICVKIRNSNIPAAASTRQSQLITDSETQTQTKKLKIFKYSSEDDFEKTNHQCSPWMRNPMPVLLMHYLQ